MNKKLMNIHSNINYVYKTHFKMKEETFYVINVMKMLYVKEDTSQHILNKKYIYIFLINKIINL